MATAGFLLPKINFLSVKLDGGQDLVKLTNEPHINDEALPNPSDAFGASSPDRMQVEIILSVEVGFDQSAGNIYSMFFKDDFTKYLKIRVVQSTDPAQTLAITNDTFNYLKQGGVIDASSFFGGVSNIPGVIVKDLEFSGFEGNLEELDGDQFTNEGRQIETKFDSSGNKIYVFPYKLVFEIPTEQGGITVENLSYFTHAYIDAQQIFLDEGPFNDFVNLPSSIVENLTMGQVNILPVIQNGTVNNFAQIFYVTETDVNGNPVPLETLENAKIWTGEVHYHGNANPGPNGYIGYMAGPPGNPLEMGPFLTEQTVLNGIIQDYREVKNIEQLNYDYSLFSNSWFNQKTTEKLTDNLKGLLEDDAANNPYGTEEYEKLLAKTLTASKNKANFGDMYLAMDGSGNTRYFFSLDMKEAIKSHSAFPKLIDYIFEDPEEANILLNQKLINSLKVYRHRIYKENVADKTVDLYESVENDVPKLVVSTTDSDDGVLIQASNQEKNETVGTISQISLGLSEMPMDYNVRFFTGTDLKTPNDGDYSFSVEIEIKDPIIEWMSEKISILETILYGTPSVEKSGLLDYVNDATSNPKYFNVYTNRFNSEGIDYLNSEYPGGFTYNKVFDFFNVLSSFTEFDENIYGLYNFLGSISGTNFGNPSGALKVYQILETTYKKILNIFSSVSKYKKPVDAPQVGADGKGQSVYLAAGSNPRRHFTISKHFKVKVEGDINHLTGYDYLSTSSTTEEDSAPILGLKRISRPIWDDRTRLETLKLFSTLSDYDISIPKHPLQVSQFEENELSPSQISAKQGPILNPEDNIQYSRNSYLSPSIINFAKSESQNMLNSGLLRTDVSDINNVMLNIIKENTIASQKFDFPKDFGVATGVGFDEGLATDQIIKPSITNEAKYDLLTIFNNRQTTVKPLDQLIPGSLSQVTQLVEKDIFDTNVDPTNMLLTTMLQNTFDILSDEIWSWAYYVLNFGWDEYQAWTLLSALQLVDSASLDPYVIENSPLKRAPNHVKCLLSNLDFTKDYSSPSFKSLKDQLKEKRPYIFTEIGNENDFYKVYGTNPSSPIENIISERQLLYQTPEYLSFFLLNFKKLVKVEALVGYESDAYGNIQINSPIWAELSQDQFVSAAQTSGQVLCRLLPYEKDLYGIKEYEALKLPMYNQHFIIDFGVPPILEPELNEDAETQGEFDSSPFFEPDSQEFLPGGQTMEEAEALVGVEGGAAGIGIATGLDAGAVTELGLTGFVGGAAGGVDVGTGAGFGTQGTPFTTAVGQQGAGDFVTIGGSGAGEPGVSGGPLGGGSVKKQLFFLKGISNNTEKAKTSSELINNTTKGSPPVSTQQGVATEQAQNVAFNLFTGGGSQGY